MRYLGHRISFLEERRDDIEERLREDAGAGEGVLAVGEEEEHQGHGENRGQDQEVGPLVKHTHDVRRVNLEVHNISQ